MAVDAKALKHRLRDRLEQRLVRQHQAPEQLLLLGARPEVLRPGGLAARLRYVERAAAPDPTFDEVGVDLARLFEREIALRDRSEPFRTEAHLVRQWRRREQVEHAVVDLVVQRGSDAMSG